MLKLLALILIISVAYAHDTGGAVVHMYDDGYEPGRLEIFQGDSVTFENTGREDHWPASNIHPTHAVYPGSDIGKCGYAVIFDACRGLKPGESFSFVFERAGVWRYHDHNFPEITGEIVVREKEGYEIKEKGPGFMEHVQMFLVNIYHAIFPPGIGNVNMLEIARDKNSLQHYLRKYGPEKIMKEILEDSGGGYMVDCHAEAHNTGRISYELYGPEVFRQGDPSCHSGFYHGAMEAMLSEKGTMNLAANIDETCSKFDTSFGVFECLHGVGHGVMAYMNYDLPASLGECDKLGTDFAKSSCYGGAFMENVVAGQGAGALPGHDTEWVSNDPHFPCNAVDQSRPVRYQCYQMQTSWMLTLAEYDFDKVADECTRSPEDMVGVCFKSFGRDAAGYTLRNPQKILGLCEKVPEEFFGDCVVGAVNVIIDFWGNALDDQATEFCTVLPSSKGVCYSVIASRIGGIHTDKKIGEICSGFEEEYRRFCHSTKP